MATHSSVLVFCARWGGCAPRGGGGGASTRGPALASKGGRAQPGAPGAQARPGPGHFCLPPSLVAKVLPLGVPAQGGVRRSDQRGGPGWGPVL